jgi:hypothetical protein
MTGGLGQQAPHYKGRGRRKTLALDRRGLKHFIDQRAAKNLQPSNQYTVLVSCIESMNYNVTEFVSNEPVSCKLPSLYVVTYPNCFIKKNLLE